MVYSGRDFGPRPLGEESTIVNGLVLQKELDFWEYHQDNPDIYHLFNRYAQSAIDLGHTRLSPWLIVNRIRWEQHVVVKTKNGFKISNDFIAYYSRLWMLDKRFPGFFSTKTLIGEYLE